MKDHLIAGTLFVVATPIGNLEDITTRALRVLREVALIAAEDTRRTGHLLARYGIATRTTSLHEHNEHGKSASLIARLENGESIALVSDAGTPTISDPGAYLIAEAIRSGIKVEPIPGANAIMAALSVSGLLEGTFSFLGFPPNKGAERRAWFARLALLGPIVVFYEAPHRIRHTLEELRDAVGDVQVMIGRELTKAHEELVRGPISSALERLIKPIGEFVIVANIGQSGENEITPVLPTSLELAREFRKMTGNEAMGRRDAISALSKKYRVGSREIFKLLEDAKNSAC